MITPEEVVERYRQRRNHRGPLLGRWEEVTRQYDGAVVVPLPEIDEVEKAAAVNLMGPGLDQMAMRVASVVPDVVYPSVRPGFQVHDEKARTRRLANLGWWDMNDLPRLIRRRARYLLGYGCSPVVLSPVPMSPLDKRDIPHWRIVNPMSSFPAPTLDPNDLEPSDIIICYRHPLSWLRERYPMAVRDLRLQKNSTPDTPVEILEYIDADETVLVAVGAPKEQDPRGWGHMVSIVEGGNAAAVELARNPNRAGIPLGVVPGRITLGRISGVFDQMMPMYQRAAKLDALELIAIQRGIFPDEWIVSHPNAPGKPQIITEADGLMGIRGEIAFGQIMPGASMNASAQVTDMAIDRLERSQRLAAGIPAEFGGESPSNIRTARRGETVLSAAIDMPIQEHQEILAASLEAENRRAVAIMKAYYGRKSTSFYLPRDGKVTREDYTPNEAFDTDTNFVKYSMPGADANSLPIALGQRVNMGTMSIQTAMETDPLIEDPIAERDRIEEEGLTRALLTSIEQGVQQGSIGPDEVAMIAQAKNESHDQLWDVVIKVHQAMQAKQAAQQQAPPGAPEAQPGIGPAGAQGQGNFNGPPAQPQLAQMLQTLAAPAQTAQKEQQGAPQLAQPLAQ